MKKKLFGMFLFLILAFSVSSVAFASDDSCGALVPICPEAYLQNILMSRASRSITIYDNCPATDRLIERLTNAILNGDPVYKAEWRNDSPIVQATGTPEPAADDRPPDQTWFNYRTNTLVWVFRDGTFWVLENVSSQFASANGNARIQTRDFAWRTIGINANAIEPGRRRVAADFWGIYYWRQSTLSVLEGPFGHPVRTINSPFPIPPGIQI